MPRKNRSNPRQTTPPMTSPALYIACREKRRFPTQRQAIHAAETQELQQSDLELRTYRCPQCQGWHLSRSKDRQREHLDGP